MIIVFVITSFILPLLAYRMGYNNCKYIIYNNLERNIKILCKIRSLYINLTNQAVIHSGFIQLSVWVTQDVVNELSAVIARLQSIDKNVDNVDR
jgi:hypothetical protein